MLSEASNLVPRFSSLRAYCVTRASGRCPTLAEAEDEARATAANRSPSGGCQIAREDSWSGGAKVLTGDGFCHQELFFDSHGELKMARTGCEGTLQQYGFGFDPSRPATKTIDFCDPGA
jgi:hypothetical protein